MPIPLAHLAEQGRVHADRTASVYEAPRAMQLWHLTSLDAPTVAVVWSLAFAWAAGVELPGWLPLLIGLSTWVVYVGDRLLDARSGMKAGTLDSLRERHFFHWRYRRRLLPVALLAGCAAAFLMFTQMPIAFRARNSMLAAAALVYFSGVHGPRRVPAWVQRILTKELLVGTLFTAGCVLPTLSRLGVRPEAATKSSPLIAASLLFAMLAWLNCHAIDRWEHRAPKTLSGAGALALCCFGAATAVVVSAHDARIAALLLAGSISAGLLAILHILRNRLTPITLRAAADLVLLTPLVLLCLPR